MTEQLTAMAIHYKVQGMRMDEVLHQEIKALVARNEYLEEALQEESNGKGSMTQLTSNIELWALDRNLISADPHKQMLKLFEEVGEIAAALARGNIAEALDGIGDSNVVLTILARQLGSSMKDCAEIAYNEIKDRKGRMIDGVFVKEADLV